MVRKFIVLMLVLSVMFTASSCSISSKDQAYIDSQFDKLFQQYEQLKEEYDELREINREMADELNNHISLNEALQSQIDYLNNKIFNLAGNPVVFTAETPKINLPNNYVLFAEFDHHQDETVSFESFANFCNENFSSLYDYFLLKPIYDEYDFHPNRTRCYSVYVEDVVENVPMNPIFTEQIMLYSDILGDGAYYEYNDDGVVPWSIEIKSYFISIEKISTDKIFYPEDIHLEFGERYDGSYYPFYINIYIENVCIGTSYYRLNTYISQRWFESYYRNYLKVFQ